VERHLAGDFGQAFHQEVRRSHSHLQSAERMFNWGFGHLRLGRERLNSRWSAAGPTENL
jgi:hypothetical protein